MKNMKYLMKWKFNRKHRTIYHAILLSLAFLMLGTIQNVNKKTIIVSAAETNSSSLPKDILITNPSNGESTIEYVTGKPTVTYNGNTLSKEYYPLVMYHFNWLADAQSFFSDAMDFDLKYSDTESASVREIQSFTLRNPRLDTTIVFTVGNDTAVVNGIEKPLPCQVMWASNAQLTDTDTENTEEETEKNTVTEDSVLLIPLVWTLQEAGYTVTSSDNAITINDSVLYYKTNYKDSYDDNIYTNRLEGVYVAHKTGTNADFLQFHTEEKLTSNDVKISDQQEETAVTLTLPNTKNSLGNVTQSFSGGIIKKIQIRETTNHATTIQIWYGVKYIYTKQYDTKSYSLQFSKISYSMRVLLPDKVNTQKITTTDQYWKNKFLIVIPGNYVNYYKKNAPLKNSSNIKSIKVTKTAENNTKITVTTKKLQGYKITYSNCGYFTVKIGSPKTIYKNIVLLDAGHGGRDNGARQNGCKEKTLNFSIIYTRAKKLFDAQNSTVKAYWTRYNDTLINLYQRPKYSKKYSADLFVSLHMNSAPRTLANGTEVYFSRLNNKANKAGLTSKIVAKRLLSTLTSDLGMNDRGVHHANFVVVKNNTVPAVLVELCYLTSPKDSKKIKKASFQNKAAKSLYKGISEIFKAYPTGR